ncbi:GNAT family N-acetyltransferase [Plantactinospora sp. BB1]|uniref:GNAT family N-acetyltransferase n=1 Tax=Plantactinospora sp. BB1 TaxID=2071627 RepID=UPI0018FE8184|nr:GNAT family N-acetyltransferase [Plantactinospora sp. BB1]
MTVGAVSADRLGAVFSDHLGGIPPGRWDGLAAGRLYSSRDWLALCAGDAGGTAGAVGVESVDGRLAALPVTAITAEGNPFYRWSEALAEAGLPAPAPVGILAGQRRGYQTHLLVETGERAVPAARAEAAASLLDRLTELPGAAAQAGLLGARPPEHPPCVAMYLDTADVLAFRAAGVGTLPVLLRPDAWIAVPAGGWGAWLASLPSPRRAELVRRESRRFDRAGYTLRETSLLESHAVAARLLAGTEARYGRATTAAAHEASLRRQATLMGPAARVLLCLRDDEPVGYVCYYLWGDTLFLRSAGFDHARLANAAEYFNLVYYLPVRIAAEAGARRIHAGIEAFDAKALRGARLSPLWLLDLSADSPLAGRDAQIRAYNAGRSRQLVESSRAVAKSWRGGVSGVPEEFGLHDGLDAGRPDPEPGTEASGDAGALR